MAAVAVWGRIVFLGGRGEEMGAWAASGEGAPDLAAIDALARLRLTAGRMGLSCEIREMCPELGELLELVGLRRELGGEAEGREQVGVEEGVEPGDPVA